MMKGELVRWVLSGIKDQQSCHILKPFPFETTYRLGKIILWQIQAI